jgi:hypothetical protein
MLLGVVLLALAINLTPGISFTEDLGRHLVLGRIILETGSVPTTNLLTHTFSDHPFINHHWLSEVMLTWLHGWFGLNGLILLKAGLMAGLVGVCVGLRPARRHPGILWLAGLMAAILLGYRSHLRPELFTYAGVVGLLAIFEGIRRGRDRCRWLLLPLIWLWANLHIYFVFGLGMAGVFFLERVLTQPVPPPRRWQELLWPLGMVGASLLTPHGVAGLLYPFRILHEYGVPITENASPLALAMETLNPMLLALPPFILLLGLAVIRPWLAGEDWRQTRPADTVIALTALAMTLWMARSVPLLALTGLPLIAGACDRRLLPRTWPWKASLPPMVRRGLARGTFVLLALVNLWLLGAVVSGAYSRMFPSPLAPTPFGFDDESRYLALRPLAQAGLPGPLFNDYNLGSLLEYQLHPQKVYCDNRPEAFPISFWQNEYFPALGLGKEWEAMIQARGIETVAVSLTGTGEGFIGELCRRPEWALVHLDDQCAVLIRDTPDKRELLRAQAWNPDHLRARQREISERLIILPDMPRWRRPVETDRIAMLLYGLVCIGRADLAWPSIQQLYLLEPDNQTAVELLRAASPPSDANAEALVAMALARRARWPLSAKAVGDWADFLAVRGSPGEARKVVSRGRWFFPFSTRLRDLSAALTAVPE